MTRPDSLKRARGTTRVEKQSGQRSPLRPGRWRLTWTVQGTSTSLFIRTLIEARAAGPRLTPTVGLRQRSVLLTDHDRP